MSTELTPNLPPIDAASGEMLQKIKYPCGCEAVGKAPMPIKCPTHEQSLAVAPKEVLISVILDESGSMSSVKDKTITGYNEYLHGLRKDGTPYLVTLTKFDSHAGDPACRVIYKNSPIATATDLTPETYSPRGGTPLFDAIGGTVKSLESEVAGRAVLVLILTDGEENQSKEYTAEAIKSLIKQKESEGWTFVYLGANQDAWKAGQVFGMNAGNTYNYQTSNLQTVFGNMATASANYARMAYDAKGLARCCTTFSASTGVADVNTNPAAQSLGKLGGKRRMASLTDEQRKKLASDAAKARWSR